MKKIAIISGIIVILIIFLALVFRFWLGFNESYITSDIKLSKAYSLIMRQEGGREFDYSKSRTYRLRNEGQEITLICSKSGGLLGKSLKATIEFDPQTLRGTWTYNLGGVVQGGAIHLNTTTHGFEFKVMNDFGPYAGSPPGYGQLVALP